MPDTSPNAAFASGSVIGAADPAGHARRLHDHDRAARELGIELTEAGLGSATARMTVTDSMLNGAGKCRGCGRSRTAGERDLQKHHRSGRCRRMRALAQRWIARPGEGTDMLRFGYALRGAK